MSSMITIRDAAMQLTEDERVQLVAELWDSLTPPTVPVGESLRDQIARRIEELDAGKVQPIPWSEARRMIQDSK